MKLANLKELVEAVGIIAIVASLLFVGMELRQSRAIAIGDGNLANAENQIAINDAINEHAAIWVRGNAGEPLNEDDAVIFGNLVRSKSIHAFMEYARLEQVEFHEAADTAAAQFSIFLFQNPGAQQAWNQAESFFARNFEVHVSQETWREKVNANLARMERGTSN